MLVRNYYILLIYAYFNIYNYKDIAHKYFLLTLYILIYDVVYFFFRITSPLLLLTVVASLWICYKLSQRHAKQELMILNMKLTLAQVYSLVGVCSLPVFYLVGAHAAVFWVLGK